MTDRVIPKRPARRRPHPAGRAEFLRRCSEAARRGGLRVRHDPARLYLYHYRLPVSPRVLSSVLEHVGRRVSKVVEL